MNAIEPRGTLTPTITQPRTVRRFRDRYDAGRQLAERLKAYANRPDVIVLALPRGGVPVGYEVAAALHVPLDLMLVRKLGVPGHEELAMGAIASGGVRVLNAETIRLARIPPAVLERVAASEQRELERRERLYRGDRPLPNVRGTVVILVDEMVCALTPEPFYSVGLWYDEFEQTSDEEVKALLERARARMSRAHNREGER